MGKFRRVIEGIDKSMEPPYIGHFHPTAESQSILTDYLHTLLNFLKFFFIANQVLVRFCKSVHICISTVRVFLKWKGCHVFTISINCFLLNKRMLNKKGFPKFQIQMKYLEFDGIKRWWGRGSSCPHPTAKTSFKVHSSCETIIKTK